MYYMLPPVIPMPMMQMPMPGAVAMRAPQGEEQTEPFLEGTGLCGCADFVSPNDGDSNCISR
jgi:hypothetical protein